MTTNRNAVYVRVLLVLIALVFLLAFVNRSPQHAEADAWVPSSFVASGAGHLAFYQTMEEMHWPVARWREPLSRLRAEGTGNVLVITRSALGARVKFSSTEIALLGSWVKRGNTVLLMGALANWDDTRALLREFGFSEIPAPAKSSVSDLFRPLENKPADQAVIPATPGSPIRGSLIVPVSDPLPQKFPPWTHVLWQRDGQPYVLRTAYGAGQVVCISSGLMLDNTFLQQGDNLAIMLALLAPGGQVPRRVFFEESHHGFSTIFALVRLLEHPAVQFSGMLALLGLLTFLGSTLLRFGPVRIPDPGAGRSTLEFVDSIADLYQRADLRNEMLDALFRETQARIVQRLHLPTGAPHEVLATRLKQAHPHLPSWKKLAHRFDSPDYMNGLPPTGWLRVARELIEIKSTLA